jgi:hypothetical protein
MEQIIDGVYIETGFTGVTLGAIVCGQHILLVDSPIKPEDVRSGVPLSRPFQVTAPDCW